MRTTLTGVFKDPEAALEAAERLRELDEAADSLRLFLPGADGQPVETLVVEERSPWLRIALWGVAVGLLCLYIALSWSTTWIYGVIGLCAGIGFGLLLGVWFGGQRYPRSVRPHMRARYLDVVRAGRAVLLVDVVGHTDDVRKLLEESGAYVSTGHWPVRDTWQPT